MILEHIFRFLFIKLSPIELLLPDRVFKPDLEMPPASYMQGYLSVMCTEYYSVSLPAHRADGSRPPPKDDTLVQLLSHIKDCRGRIKIQHEKGTTQSVYLDLIINVPQLRKMCSQTGTQRLDSFL